MFFGTTIREIWIDMNSLVFDIKTQFLDAFGAYIGNQVDLIARELSRPILAFIENSLRKVQVS